MQFDDSRITYFGRTTFRNAGVPFGIRRSDRRYHLYTIGKTGMGKSTLLATLLRQDVLAGEGFAVFDPHGDLADRVINQIRAYRRQDVVHLNVPDQTLKWSFNPFAGIQEDQRALAAAGIVEAFRSIWPDDWGPRLEHLLRNVAFTLLEVPGSTLADIPPLLTDKDFRATLVTQVHNEAVRNFWESEYARYSVAFRAVVIAPLQNKIGALLTDPLLYRVLTGSEGSIDLRAIMDSGKMLVVNLDKGRIGPGPSSLLGSLLVTHIALKAFSRRDIQEQNRRDFFVYLDEFHTFTTLTIATMLSELRKYRVNLVLANQYLSQLDSEVHDAIFGNVGTVVAFRLGSDDAAFFGREFAPVFDAEDFLNLPLYRVYLRLAINGQMSQAFSASIISPDDLPRTGVS
jgi:type IV secretory pathway TraG/TraD family ATPase VirD4